MIFFAIYAMGVWMVAWRYRRRWQSFAAIVAGVPPIALSARLDAWLLRAIFDEDALWLYTIAGVFAGLIVFIGLLLAVQPRAKPEYVCKLCGYDLRGVLERMCPECGVDPSAKRSRGKKAAMRNPASACPPARSLGSQLAAARRDRMRESSQFSAVTSPPPSAPTSTTSGQ